MRRATGTWWMLAALWCACVLPCLHAQEPAGTADADLQEQEVVLTGENASPEQREEAARKLVSRQTPEARRILKDVLESSGNPKGQLAVARALGGDTSPDPEFIAPLFALMGPTNKLATESAATALVNYKNNRKVIDDLVEIIDPPKNRPRQKETAVRVAVARSAGALLEKRVASALVNVVAGADELQIVRDAAADGLLGMTSLRENGRDAMRWQQWWAANERKSDDQFRLDLLNQTALQRDQVAQRLKQLTEGIAKILSEQYQAAPLPDKPGTLLRYMGASQPEIRATGVRIIQEEFQNGRGISPAARQLRTMVGDSSAEVRLAVASTLGSLNDPDAVPALLVQVAQEPEPEVRSQIVKALGLSNSPKAAEQVVRMLDDKATVVVDTAVVAIQKLPVKLAEVKPELAKSASTKLRALLGQRGSALGNSNLRLQIVTAMATLNDPDSVPVYRAVLRNPKEIVPTRRAALKALEALARLTEADLIREAVEDEDPSLRVAALQALEPVASRDDTELLWRRIDPRIETDKSVSDAAWRVFSSLLPEAPKDWLEKQVKRLEDRAFQNDGGRSKLLLVLQALDAAYLKDKLDDQRAANWQVMGGVHMEMKAPKEAVRNFRMAYNYLSGQPNPQQAVSERLINDTLGAYLAAKMYADGIQFAGEVIVLDARYQETVGRLIYDDADRLKNQGNLDDARLLLTEAVKLKLEKRFGEKIIQLAAEVDRMIQAKNGKAPSSGPRSSLTLIWPGCECWG